MTWFTTPSASINNGQSIVVIVGGDDISIAQEAGGLIIGTNPPVEIKRTFRTESGLPRIELARPWPYANQNNQPAVAFPTDADLAEATRVLRELSASFSVLPQAGSIAVRTETGKVKTANATEANDAVALGQLGNAAYRTVTTSATDTNVGRVLKVGDFGVGSTSLVNNIDFNNAKYTSFEGTNSGANMPAQDGSIGVRKTYAYSPDWVAQEYFQISSQPRDFTRAFYAGIGWSEWAYRYTNRNIIGAVSQSSGTPTGAIIERGGNVNGQYVKYADGTQICWGTKSVNTSQLNSEGSFSFYTNGYEIQGAHAFPVSFVDGASYTVIGTDLGSRLSVAAAPHTGSSFYMTTSISNTNISAAAASYLAIGRWF